MPLLFVNPLEKNGCQDDIFKIFVYGLGTSKEIPSVLVRFYFVSKAVFFSHKMSTMSEEERRRRASRSSDERLSLHENESDDGDVDGEDAGTGNNNTMMSIFASYYGIEDDSKKNKLLIDSPQFDADEYIQVSLKIFLIFL